jgi:tripartite-type tricarboxylate transporter receptor subunit TctC
MLAPARTPADIVKRLHDETMKVLAQPGVAAKLKPQGLEPMPLTPAEFDALIAKEIETNKAIVKAAGLKFN